MENMVCCTKIKFIVLVVFKGPGSEDLSWRPTSLAITELENHINIPTIYADIPKKRI